MAFVLALWIAGCVPDSAGTFSISGKITDNDGAALSGVSIVLTGDNSGLVVTDAGGLYELADLAEGTYTVRVNKTGYAFDPSRRSVTIAGADAAAIDFVGTPSTATPAVTYSLSGKIVDSNGAPLAQVSVKATRAETEVASTVSTSAGTFVLTGLANGDYTVTPALNDYSFTPASMNVSIAGASKSGFVFAGSVGGASPAPQFSVSGRIINGSNQAVAGVTVTLSDGVAQKTTTTPANGNYSFTGLVPGKYVVTPSLAGLTFTPASRSIDIITANVTGVDFSAGTVSAATFSISGSVLSDTSSVGIAGVTVTLGGEGSGSAMTNASGVFTFTNLPNGNYTVAPSLTGYIFNPTSLPAVVNGAGVTGLKFAGTPPPPPTYTVSGKITTGLSNTGLAGVALSLKGTSTPPFSANTTTDAAGNFRFEKITARSYSVAPSLTGYTFNPASMDITVTNDVLGLAFSAEPVAAATYTLSGKIATAGGTAVSGVSVGLGGPSSANTTTDGGGNYAFAGLATGSYTVTPTLAGYTFDPANKPVTITNADVPNTNFTAVPPTFTLSGRIATSSNAAIANVSVALSGGTAAKTAMTDAGGNYNFTALAPGNYTVTPALAGYTFAPLSIPVTVSNANVANTNFVGTATPPATYSLSGTITTGGAPLAGATVALSGGAATTSTTTSAAGAFAFSGLTNGTYVVTPNMSGYSFTPGNKTVTIAGANVSATNFTAAITGPVTRNYTLYVVAGTLTISGGGGTAIPAWSYSDSPTTAKFPGPQLTANEGDTVNITVTNNHSIPHNLTVKGINDVLDATPIAPGTTKSYTFVADKAGTYAYYDTLNNNINREMGLYGAVVVAPPNGGNNAWAGGPGFSFQRVWVVSDIDKTRWNDVASTGGTVNTSVYRPNYFVINGMGGKAAMEDKVGTAIDGKVGQSALVRIINAGQYTQTFHFHSNHVQVLTVNGERRTAPFKLLDVLSIPPLGTSEVLYVLNQPGNYPMHNHTAQMETANGAYPNGVGTAIYIAP